MLGGLTKYDHGYRDIETFEEISYDLMVSSPNRYVVLTTYKIVHFLSMTSRLYITHIKIKWIVNDINHVYLQEVMELETSELAKGLVKFRLPPKEENLEFYKNSDRFIQIYKEMKRRREIGLLQADQLLKGKNFKETSSLISADCELEK